MAVGVGCSPPRRCSWPVGSCCAVEECDEGARDLVARGDGLVAAARAGCAGRAGDDDTAGVRRVPARSDRPPRRAATRRAAADVDGLGVAAHRSLAGVPRGFAWSRVAGGARRARGGGQGAWHRRRARRAGGHRRDVGQRRRGAQQPRRARGADARLDGDLDPDGACVAVAGRQRRRRVGAFAGGCVRGDRGGAAGRTVAQRRRQCASAGHAADLAEFDAFAESLRAAPATEVAA